MSNNKVVQFPKSKIVREAPVDIEVLEKAKEKGIQNFADSVVEDIIGFVVGDLENYGVDVEDEQFIKDFSSISTKVNLTTFLTITRQSVNQVIIKSKKYLNRTAFIVF